MVRDGWSLPATRLSTLRQLDATDANGSRGRRQIKRSWLLMNSKAHFGTQPLLETPEPSVCKKRETPLRGPLFHTLCSGASEERDHGWNGITRKRALDNADKAVPIHKGLDRIESRPSLSMVATNFSDREQSM